MICTKYTGKEKYFWIITAFAFDTEFNATDYAEQNDGVQEITEIGAVIFRNGKPAERFFKVLSYKKRTYPYRQMYENYWNDTRKNEKKRDSVHSGNERAWRISG